ncbi:hypothetical protein B9479_000985 [Cryptococcus floricola]|uniref:Alpha and gamma adaptin binding protein p34 n=1 Tax=Cryptococcus floricola TaxID=2591691 RepID=A0A5D3B6G0_9TREE|nr:hypothetical protein B9479_000985 [Cryptococcus floricola]
MSSDTSNTILLLHPPSLDPTHFLSRLTERDLSSVDASIESVNWEINNRYYTAQVELRAFPIDKELFGSSEEGDGAAGMKQWEGADVVVYIFDQVPASLPPQLVRLMATPRDIALAVCILPDASSEAAVNQEGDFKDLIKSHKDDGAEEARVEELFDELGMEFIDEVHPLTDEDDERPMPPLHIIRQTLQTHMWPGMARKPLHASSQLPGSPTSSIGSGEGQGSLDHAAFDVTFDVNASPLPRQNAHEDKAGDHEQKEETVFPDLSELRAQLASAEFGSIDALDRYAHLFSSSESDSGFPSAALAGLDGPYMSLNDMDLFPDGGDGGKEYERLEDWLEKDDDEFEPELLRRDQTSQEENAEQETPKEGDWLENDDKRFEPSLSGPLPELKPGEDWQKVEHGHPTDSFEEEGFEDDFDSFQSAQPRAETLALDPTPLLLHLQQVRSELSSLNNEDERRERAGAEVATMLNMLGMGLDEGEEGLLDFDEFAGEELADTGTKRV